MAAQGRVSGRSRRGRITRANGRMSYITQPVSSVKCSTERSVSAMKTVKVAVLVFSSMMMSASAHADVLYAKASSWIYLNKTTGYLQHVYVCAGRPSYGVNEICKANPGSNSGGAYLSGTLNTGSTSKMTCASGGLRCQIAWGVTGTCQQGANRMLYTAGRTVANAGGYSISSRLFGTYGTGWSLCKSACSM